MRMLRQLIWTIALTVFPGMTTDLLVAQPVPASSASVVPAPPIPPFPPSPVQPFRQLLATNEAGRQAWLATKSPSQRKLLEAKLAEYEALPPAERELRLTLTELRWYLMPLLRSAPEARSNYLASVPERFRPLLEERVRQWDGLPEAMRSELLTNEPMLSFILRLEKSTPAQSRAMLNELTPENRKKMEAALEEWRKQPAERRQTIAYRLNQFFELRESEKAQLLRTLPEKERQPTAQMLAIIERLPKEDRERCLASLEAFAKMSPAEQEQFMRNAARWQAMTPRQRETLRIMLQKVPPLPPIPPGMLAPATAQAGATNSSSEKASQQ